LLTRPDTLEQTLPAMQVMQVTYGLSTAVDVVFFTYIYRLVKAADYQRVVRLGLAGAVR
jgi:hypothetical protein